MNEKKGTFTHPRYARLEWMRQTFEKEGKEEERWRETERERGIHKKLCQEKEKFTVRRQWRSRKKSSSLPFCYLCLFSCWDFTFFPVFNLIYTGLVKHDSRFIIIPSFTSFLSRNLLFLCRKQQVLHLLLELSFIRINSSYSYLCRNLFPSYSSLR